MFCIMRDIFADLVAVVDVGSSLRTTEYSPNRAGRHLLC